MYRKVLAILDAEENLWAESIPKAGLPLDVWKAIANIRAKVKALEESEKASA